jgi:hypothetical protein
MSAFGLKSDAAFRIAKRLLMTQSRPTPAEAWSEPMVSQAGRRRASSLQNLNQTGMMRVRYLADKISLIDEWGGEWIFRIGKSL